jgi:type VI protein secretion system component VasF
MCASLPRVPNSRQQRTFIMNRIVWLVGAVVIVLLVLGFFGLR